MIEEFYTIEVKHQNVVDEEWEYIHFPYYTLNEAKTAVHKAIVIWQSINPIIDYRFVKFIRGEML